MILSPKRCWKCGETKELSAFPRRSRSRDGHDDRCSLCNRVAARKQRLADVDKARAYAREYGRLNSEARDVRGKKWMTENKERRRAWRKHNAERLSGLFKEWAKVNPERITFKKAKRRAAKLKATPHWVDPKDLLPFYELSRALTNKTGVKHHVDHIWPLQGENFCGLNVPWNLQVLTAFENQSKKNKAPVDI